MQEVKFSLIAVPFLLMDMNGQQNGTGLPAGISTGVKVPTSAPDSIHHLRQDISLLTQISHAWSMINNSRNVIKDGSRNAPRPNRNSSITWLIRLLLFNCLKTELL